MTMAANAAYEAQDNATLFARVLVTGCNRFSFSYEFGYRLGL
jgi:hypothetical protein